MPWTHLVSPKDISPDHPARHAAGPFLRWSRTLSISFRLTWTSFLALFVAFTLLQSTRHALWHEIRAEMNPDVTHIMSPEDVGVYSDWFWNAWNLSLGRTMPLSWSSALTAMVRDEPRYFIPLTGLLAGCMLVSSTLFALWLTVLGMRSRLVPYELTADERHQLADSILRLLVPWSVFLAALIGSTAWYICIDRTGRTESLWYGLLPTLKQATCIVVTWSCLLFLGGLVGLLHSISSMRDVLNVRGQVCKSCRYPLIGLIGRQCPECGRVNSSPQALLASWHPHRTLSVVLSSVVLGVVTIAGLTALLSPRTRDWLALRPPRDRWVYIPGKFLDGTNTLHLEAIYGRISLDAHPPKDGKWIISWTLEPAAGAVDFQRVAALTVPEPPSGWSHAVKVDTPCGPLWFFKTSDDPRLNVGHLGSVILR